MREPTEQEHNKFNVAADEFADELWKAFEKRVKPEFRIATELPLVTAKQMRVILDICKDIYIAGLAQGAESTLTFHQMGKDILNDGKKSN